MTKLTVNLPHIPRQQIIARRGYCNKASTLL